MSALNAYTRRLGISFVSSGFAVTRVVVVTA